MMREFEQFWVNIVSLGGFPNGFPLTGSSGNFSRRGRHENVETEPVIDQELNSFFQCFLLHLF